MLYGSVKYGLTNGKDVTVDWAGRALMERNKGRELKMGFYQVYLVSGRIGMESLMLTKTRTRHLWPMLSKKPDDLFETSAKRWPEYCMLEVNRFPDVF
jgi:hypothetical protein